MPCYNCAAFIEEALRSVFVQQGNFSVQLIVADGNSTDGTQALLAGLEREADETGVVMEWFSEPDAGQSDALNKTLPKITGDVVTWLNGDDWYAPGAFAVVAEMFEGHRADIVLGNCTQMGEDGPLQGVPERSFVNDPRNVMPFTGGDEWVLVTPEVFFRHTLIDGFRYDLCLDYFMDVDLWMHLFLPGPDVFKLERTLAFFRSHDECKTIRAWKRFLPRLLVEDHILLTRYRDRVDAAYAEARFTKLMVHFLTNWRRLGMFEPNMNELERLVRQCSVLDRESRDCFDGLLHEALRVSGEAANG
jgi:glycosyltransferase involved in cell wall biosynthesis